MHFHPRVLATALLALSLFAPRPAGAAPRFRPVRDDVFYMFMPIAWRDSDGDPNGFGDFGGMTASLPYLKSLGVTAVWMTPIFPSAAYHGYQHGRADSLSARFGDEAQFLSFVQAAHAESIKVLIDFVAYGISQNSVWYKDAYANPASPYSDWLAFNGAGNTNPLGSSYTTWDGETVGFVNWNLNNSAVTDMVIGWAKHWLDPNGDGDPADGIDGYRLDHVSYADSTESYWGYNIDWWYHWKLQLRALYPDAFTVAEQADWGYGSEFLGVHDAVFTKPLESAARYAIAHGNAYWLADRMNTTLSLLPEGGLNLATLGDHDVDRLATVLGDVPGRSQVAAEVLMLQPLPPVLYFGDELGMLGAKRYDFAGDASDIPNREPFKWKAVAGAPMSSYFALNTQAYAQRVSRDNDGRSVEEQSGVPGSLLERYRALSALRHAHPGLRHGDYYAVSSPDTAVWAFLKLAPEETLLVVVNLGATDLTAHVDLSFMTPDSAGTPTRDVETLAAFLPVTLANRGAWPVQLPAYGYRVLDIPLQRRDLRPKYANANVVVTQSCPPPDGDNIFELDQMFVRYQADGLALGITGNLPDGGYPLTLFFDAAIGGQSTLSTSGFATPPYSPYCLSGMTFDDGFQPEVALVLNIYAGQLYADYFTLATGGGGTHRYLGTVAVGAGGPLTGGTNTNGLRANYSNTNRLGVSPGNVLTGATATDGFEFVIPWADLGLAGPGAEVKLLALLCWWNGYVFNQFLPSLGGILWDPGYAPDLRTVPGTFLTLGNTTGAQASLVDSRVVDGVASVTWSVPTPGARYTVTRCAGSGDWSRLGEFDADGVGRVFVSDPGVTAGARYGYRLFAAGNPALVLAEAWVDVPAVARFALRGVLANPTTGPLRVAFELTGHGPASLELFDIGGRRVAVMDASPLGAGPHELDLSTGRRLAPGVYVVQLREGAAVRRTRAVVLHN